MKSVLSLETWRLSLKLSSALALCLPVAARAQDSAPEPASGTDQGDIIVTAQKRSENLQHVPISMVALGETSLQQHQVQSFDDYTKQLPSASYQSFGPGQSQLFFRGITSGGDGLPFGALPTSGVYIDEIPVTTIGALLDIHIYDVARIEALSGPQGTLFGASSLSGTLRIITNKPDPAKFAAGFDLTGGTYGKGAGGGTIEGFVNLPLSRTVALRAVGWYEHDGGYIDNTLATRIYQRPHTAADGVTIVTSPYAASNAAFVKKNFNDVETYGGRLALGIDLDEGWTIQPEIMGQHQHANGSFLYDPRAGDLTVHDFAPEYNIDQWYQAALTVQGKIGDWDVLYSGGYMDRKIETAADYSYYTVAYDTVPDVNYLKTASGQDIDPMQWFNGMQALTKQTHELRVSSPADRRLRLTAGLFMQRQSNRVSLNYDLPGLSQNVYAGWWNGAPLRGDTIFATDTRIVDRDYAMFGQLSYDLTPKLTLTGGIRGFIANNSLFGFSGYSADAAAAGCAIPLAAPSNCSNLDKKALSAGETHKAGLTWQIDRDHMVYATYATGFRPGGNNRRSGVNAYQPDTLDNFEIGWKTSWFDKRLTLNGAIYYEKWRNLQYALTLEGSGSLTNIYNAGNARVYGVEVNAQLHPARGLTVSTSGAYNDAALSTNFCTVGLNSSQNCSAGVAAPAGTRLPVQPRFKFNGTVRYDLPLGSIGAHVQGSVLHQSLSTSFLGTADNNAVGNSPGFTTFDFSAGISRGGSSIEMFIQNAFDERGSLSHNVFTVPLFSGQYYRILPIKPQYFGVKLSKMFG